jgi:acetyl esterase
MRIGILASTIIAIISAMVGYMAVRKGEMDLPSFMFAEAARLVVRDLFPTKDLKNLGEVREFLESQTAVSLCMEYKVKCRDKRGDTSSFNASQIPILDRTEDGVINNPAASIHFRVYYPHQDPKVEGEGVGVLLWLHGGGFVLGSVEGDDHRAALLANGTGMAVVSVEYRLAPEHPYPAALNDAIAILRWLLEAGEAHERFDLRSDRVFIGGESAGATLALSATLKYLRDHDSVGYPVRGMLLVYPPLDMNYNLESYVTKANTNGALSASQMQWFWKLYAGRGNGTLEYCLERDPFFCPGLAPAALLSRPSFPPVYLHLASHDVLYSEGLAFAERLMESQGGHKVRVTTYRHSVHGFFFVNMFPEHSKAVATASAQLKAEFDRLEAAERGGSA